MRLIDADAFNDWILSHFAEPQSALILTLQGFIAEQTTAYDIDNVVEELGALKDGYDHSCLDNAYERGVEAGAKWIKKKAIEIVKQGGVSDDVCEWRVCDEEANVYDTSCRNPHILIEGTPRENNYKFCPYCGKKIKAVE